MPLQPAARAWAAGVEVAAEALPSVPSRTLNCNGREFKRLRIAAQSPGRSICCLPLLSPVSRRAAVWYGVTSVCDLTYTAFVVALSLAFNQNIGIELTWLGGLDITGSIIYVLDLLMGFHMGVVARWENRAVVVQDGRTAAMFYIRHGTFWADMVATLPLLAQIAVAISGRSASALRLIYMLRLLRLVRVYRLLSNLSTNSVSGPLQFLAAALTTRSLLLLHAFFSLCVLVNLLGCIWWNLAVDQGLENSWAVSISKDFDLLTANNVERWLVSCYFALTTMVTIGYGDITPYTYQEVAVTMLFEVVGVAFFGYLLNVVTTLITNSGPAAKRAEAVRQKLEEVEDAMNKAGLSSKLQRRIRQYFTASWRPPQTFDGHYQFLKELPPKLRERVMAQRQLPALKELGFLPRGMRREQLKRACLILASASQPIILAPDERLPPPLPAEGPAAAGDQGEAQGKPLPCFYLLGEGRLSIKARPRSEADVFAGPALLGLAELFAMEPAIRDALGACAAPAWQHDGAVALTTCQMWRVDCTQLYPLLRQSHSGLLRHLALKLLALMEGANGGGSGGPEVPPPAPKLASPAVAAPAGLQLAEGQQWKPGADGSVELPTGALPPPPPQMANGSDVEQGRQGSSVKGVTGEKGGASSSLCELLRQLAAELAAEEKEAQQAQQGLTGGKSETHHTGSVLTFGTTSHGSGWQEGWEEEGDDDELAGVDVSPDAPEAGAGPLAVVWHCD